MPTSPIRRKPVATLHPTPTKEPKDKEREPISDDDIENPVLDRKGKGKARPPSAFDLLPREIIQECACDHLVGASKAT